MSLLVTRDEEVLLRPVAMFVPMHPHTPIPASPALTLSAIGVSPLFGIGLVLVASHHAAAVRHLRPCDDFGSSMPPVTSGMHHLLLLGHDLVGAPVLESGLDGCLGVRPGKPEQLRCVRTSCSSPTNIFFSFGWIGDALCDLVGKGLVLIIPVAHHALAPRARSRHSTPGLHALRVSHHSEADR